MTILNKKKSSKAKIWLGAAMALLLLAAFLFSFRTYFLERGVGEEALEEPFGEGKEDAPGEEGEETEDGEDGVVFEDSEPIGDDLRIHGFPYIKSTGRLKVGDYIDVRISFANGADFVLLSKKRVQGMGPLGEDGADALWLTVSEEEVLRLSSAAVDAHINNGCSIYAIQYLSETQKEAVVNYMASDLVRQLMEDDPNIAKKAENVQEWPSWELYRDSAGGGEDSSQSSGKALPGQGHSENNEEVYPEQEDIIYMD